MQPVFSTQKRFLEHYDKKSKIHVFFNSKTLYIKKWTF